MQTGTSALAVGSFVCALVGISVVAIVLGVMGQNEIDRSRGTLGGRGLATAGVWIGCLVLLFQLILVIAILGAANDAGVAVLL